MSAMKWPQELVGQQNLVLPASELGVVPGIQCPSSVRRCSGTHCVHIFYSGWTRATQTLERGKGFRVHLHRWRLKVPGRPHLLYLYNLCPSLGLLFRDLHVTSSETDSTECAPSPPWVKYMHTVRPWTPSNRAGTLNTWDNPQLTCRQNKILLTD